MNVFDLLSGQGVFLIFCVFVLLFIALAARFVSSRSSSASGASYKRLDTLLTPAERSFYGVLCQSVSDDVVVCPKVRVADVVGVVKSNRSSWQISFNRIAMKHFDFVVCGRDSFDFKYVVELDDSSHSGSKRVKRDQFLDDVCSSLGLPLVRFRARASYSISSVSDEISRSLSLGDEVVSENVVS
ncbi:DUF2726 domain-containing protein [Desulfuromonas acetoxidans]|uniref:DUF2726 domain-containing protein n=1 Tax=Desulfuromonas acetoxidans TaxID=891 RepID=UPI00292E4883|nr:DUF2726 domain-containing protein [Desulfuromonas acetoxidans]